MHTKRNDLIKSILILGLVVPGVKRTQSFALLVMEASPSAAVDVLPTSRRSREILLKFVRLALGIPPAIFLHDCME